MRPVRPTVSVYSVYSAVQFFASFAFFAANHSEKGSELIDIVTRLDLGRTTDDEGQRMGDGGWSWEDEGQTTEDG